MKQEVWCVKSVNVIEFLDAETAVSFAVSASAKSEQNYRIAVVNNQIWCVRESNIIQFGSIDAAEEYSEEFSQDAEYLFGVASVLDNLIH